MSQLTAFRRCSEHGQNAVRHSGKKVPGRDTWADLIRFAAINHAHAHLQNGSTLASCITRNQVSVRSPDKKSDSPDKKVVERLNISWWKNLG